MIELFNIVLLIREYITVVFSFMPSWVLLLIGSGSLIFLGVFVYKLVR